MITTLNTVRRLNHSVSFSLQIHHSGRINQETGGFYHFLETVTIAVLFVGCFVWLFF